MINNENELFIPFRQISFSTKTILEMELYGGLFKVAGFVRIAGSDFKTFILKVCLFQIPLHGFIVVVND